MKNVMIPEELFGKIIKYHLLDQEQEADDIRKGLEKKLDAMVNREVYSKFKTAPTEEEREKFRQEYLDRKGMQEELSMVTVLIDYLFTGACHAPVRSKQGESW